MKQPLTFLALFLSIVYTQAQPPVIQWQKCLGGTADDYAQTIQITPDGGCILAGDVVSNNGDVTLNHGGSDCWVTKLNANGVLEWQKSLGGSFGDTGYSIQNTAGGGYILACTSNSNDGDVTGNHGDEDYWIVKLNAEGNIQWQKSLGGSGRDVAYTVQVTADGGYIAAGHSDSNNGNVTGNHGGADYWVVKLDGAGNIQWQKSLGGSNNEVPYAIQTTPDGGYVLAGFTYSNNGDVSGNHSFYYDYWVVKINASGVLQWQKALGGSGDDRAFAVQNASDGGYIVAGFSASTDGNVTGNHGDYDFWVVKLDTVGNIQWQKSLGGTNGDLALTVETTLDGGYVIAGQSNSNDGDISGNHGGYDSWVIKLDADGNIAWQKSLGGTGNEYAVDIQVGATEGDYFIANNSYSTDGDVTGNHGVQQDFWVVKLEDDRLASPVFENQTIAVYPNPVGHVLQIKMPANTNSTSVKIGTTDGKVVLAQAPNGNTLNVENLSQGIYILEVYSGDEKYTSKFLKE
ncbi:T9SS type A sorting domain-containing protein [Flavobacterium sp. XGLA_31]|uniref:T9SS type A sorting domain-containing protein n=1 Tax=Flavobacterium sp. XGLA_31 TaxID=3447666 RepID=UPI003F3E2680